MQTFQIISDHDFSSYLIKCMLTIQEKNAPAPASPFNTNSLSLRLHYDASQKKHAIRG